MSRDCVERVCGGKFMNESFIKEDFLLGCEKAVELYENFAKDEPILDYHCHLPPAQIAEDTRFENITQVWLHGDHYKWRAMRANGIPERFCTGNASDREKFFAWAETVPRTLRNPLYHWTHLELKRYFSIECLLSPETAEVVWERCNELLQAPDYSARGLMKMMNVSLVCTTDDPTDTLEEHSAIARDDSFQVIVLPTFRPDRALMLEPPQRFNEWVDKLSEVAGVDVGSFDELLDALKKRHDFFAEKGCRISDHGVETLYAEDYTLSEIRGIFEKARSGRSLEQGEVLKFRSCMLYELALMDYEKGWVQQFHIGALRNPNTRMYDTLGPDMGFDCIGDFGVARPLAKFLDRLESQGKLTKTILYNLNPRDNELLVSLAGSFQDGSTPGKIQYGSAWWFLDQKSGIEAQLDALSNLGLLSRFVGMLTDSRSLLSYPRHEYFRRVLCNILGWDMEKGLIPDDIELVGEMVRDICYRNAVRYFGFESEFGKGDR